MPLYMDFHKIENLTVEAVKTAHIADVAIQEKYGVRYHQFWVNELAGTVFCLMEGPDKESCEAVHHEAHGNIACAMSEVEPGFYEKLMGKDHKLDYGHVQHINGTVDLGYRNILVVSVYGITTAKNSQDLSLLLTPHWARKLVIDKFSMFNGREIKWDIDDSLIAIFNDSTTAVRCALQLQKELVESKIKNPAIFFKIGISAAQPVTKEGDFFTEAIRLAHRLSNIANNNQVLISSLVKKLCKEDLLLSNNHLTKSLTHAEEDFLSKLLNTSEAKLAGQDFDLNNLSSGICVSRPQLYRKITALTGKSPHHFMLDLRMDKALALLTQKNNNIAEIAYQTGFNSPSYFTKCFTEKFGCSPSLFAKVNLA